MAWSVNFDPRAFSELKKLDPQTQTRIIRFLQEHVAGPENPRRMGKALKGDKGDLWRYRVGDYPAAGQIQDERSVVLVLRVARRREVYR